MTGKVKAIHGLPAPGAFLATSAWVCAPRAKPAPRGSNGLLPGFSSDLMPRGSNGGARVDRLDALGGAGDGLLEDPDVLELPAFDGGVRLATGGSGLACVCVPGWRWIMPGPEGRLARPARGCPGR